MDASQWPQHHQMGGLGRTMEEIQGPNNIMNTNMSTNSTSNSMVERKVRPQNKDQVINCPRCNSTNTKFCYYNNYSLAQPRYFCKTCRRYWTHGGSLRNVPVGGGSRKNKRSSPSILANPSSKIINPNNLNPPNTFPHLVSTPTTTTTTNNKISFLDAHDLNLAFPMQGNISNSAPMASRGGLSSYVPMSMPDPNSPLYPSGLPNLQEFKGVFSSSQGGDHNGNNNDNNNNGARLLFPFADMNKLASSVKSAHDEHDHHDQTKGDDHDHQHQHHDHHHHHQGPTGYYWSGMLGGGTW